MQSVIKVNTDKEALWSRWNLMFDEDEEEDEGWDEEEYEDDDLE
jgi:hypothetical protein